MADDKDPFRQLKSLALLKGQLEDIQKQMENEVQVGASQVQNGRVMGAPFLKGLLAGYIIAKLRMPAIMGLLMGTCTGICAAQMYKVPNIEQTIKGYFSSSRKSK